MRFVLTAVAVVVAVNSAWAQDKQPEKSQEDKLREQAAKEKLDALQEKTKNIPEKDPFIAFFWKDGLKFKAGEVVEGALGGRFYFIYRHVFDRHELSNPTSADTFAVDTARVMLDLTVYKDWVARVEMEFGKGSATSGNSDKSFFLKDGYVGWKGVPECQVTLGQFKAPFSQEETCSSRFTEFAERSLLNQVAPQHDIGIMFKGSLFENIFTYELAFTNGGQAGGARNSPDDSEEKDVTLRARALPWINDEGGVMKNFRVGLAACLGDVDTRSLRDFTTADYGNMTIIDFTGTEDGTRRRLGFELTWNVNQFGLRAEVAQMNQEVIGGGNREDFDTLGWYIQGSWIVTGEAQPMENRIKPANPFSLSEGKWGAVQIAVRICSIDADDADVSAIPATANKKVMQFGLAVNWWLTSFFRATMDIEHFKFDEDVVSGGEPDSSQTVVYFRFQMDW